MFEEQNEWQRKREEQWQLQAIPSPRCGASPAGSPAPRQWAHVGISSAVWSGFAQIEELRSQLDEERVARKKLEATVRAVSHGGSHGTRSGDASRRGTDTARTVD